MPFVHCACFVITSKVFLQFVWTSFAGLILHVDCFIYGCHYSGILVPGGFGIRGTEGKLQAISWARTKKKPFLGKIVRVRNYCVLEVYSKLIDSINNTPPPPNPKTTNTHQGRILSQGSKCTVVNICLVNNAQGHSHILHLLYKEGRKRLSQLQKFYLLYSHFMWRVVASHCN